MALLVLAGPTVFTAPPNPRAAKTVILAEYKENAAKVSKSQHISLSPYVCRIFIVRPRTKNLFVKTARYSLKIWGPPLIQRDPR